MKKCLDFYLEQRMNSTDGDKIKETLEAISLEEKKCLELFKIQQLLNSFSLIRTLLDLRCNI